MRSIFYTCFCQNRWAPNKWRPAPALPGYVSGRVPTGDIKTCVMKLDTCKLILRCQCHAGLLICILFQPVRMMQPTSAMLSHSKMALLIWRRVRIGAPLKMCGSLVTTKRIITITQTWPRGVGAKLGCNQTNWTSSWVSLLEVLNAKKFEDC